MKLRVLLLVVLAAGASGDTGAGAPDTAPPHIVFALIDDLGWHDVGHHNEELHTPNMNALLQEGIELDRHYAYRFCSPTRSSLMSGRYPMHVNQWNHVGSTMGGGVGANFTIIAKKLKSAGYSTHQVSARHWGRGFESLHCTLHQHLPPSSQLDRSCARGCHARAHACAHALVILLAGIVGNQARTFCLLAEVLTQVLGT